MARLFLVVDTNILLTHLAVLEHLREMVRRAPARGEAAGGDRPDDVDIAVVVPWIVLYELDRIKSERPDSQGAPRPPLPSMLSLWQPGRVLFRACRHFWQARRVLFRACRHL